MKHRIGFNRLSKKTSYRKALLRNMVTSLLRYESIKTTKAKAKEVRKLTEKIITRAKLDSVHNRRMIARKIYDNSVISKLFTEIGPRYNERMGGYTRILKLGQRKGDSADIVQLELVDKKERTVREKQKKAQAEEKK